MGAGMTPTPEPLNPKCLANCLWAVLIARIRAALPLLCSICAGQMRIVAFITDSADIRHLQEPIGVQAKPLHIAPARGSPLWEGCEARQVQPNWDEATQPAPAFEAGQRGSW
jgi:hypothetical protein